MMKRLTSLLIALTGLTLSSCAPDTSAQSTRPEPRRHFADQPEQTYALKQFAVYDPAEDTNKHIYTFNAELDKYVLIPVVDAYKFVTPEPVRHGISNFFLNVGEVNNFSNAVFQLKPYQATKTLGRFVVNSTVGLAGTFDVATGWGLPRAPEDFGKTLGYWGAGAGPYIVLPVLGPSNLRDTVGQIVDYATMYIIIPNSVQDSWEYDVIAYGLEPIDMRYSNDFRYYSTDSPFEYEMVRYIYTQSRDQKIRDERK